MALRCFWLFVFFDFCWVLLFPKLFSWNGFFSRINVIDSWWWFCVFEETSDVLHPKPVSCFGTFFTIFFQSYSISDFLERPDLVCNHTSCSILGVFLLLRAPHTRKEFSIFYTHVFFLFVFWILCFFWSFEICSDFAYVIYPLKSLFSQGELEDVLWNCFFRLNFIEGSLFSVSFAGQILSSRNVLNS